MFSPTLTLRKSIPAGVIWLKSSYYSEDFSFIFYCDLSLCWDTFRIILVKFKPHCFSSISNWRTLKYWSQEAITHLCTKAATCLTGQIPEAVDESSLCLWLLGVSLQWDPCCSAPPSHPLTPSCDDQHAAAPVDEEALSCCCIEPSCWYWQHSWFLLFALATLAFWIFYSSELVRCDWR